MSDIQRWYVQNPPGQPTEFVSYADHVAALAAQATAHEAALAEERENAADYWGNRAFDHYRDGLKAGRDQVMTASYAQAVAQGVSDERARVRAVILDHYKVAPKAATPLLRLLGYIEEET